MNLNIRAYELIQDLFEEAEGRGITTRAVDGGGRLIDLGIEARGGLLAGLDLARICLAGLGEVTIVPGEIGGRACPSIQVVTDHPGRACLASQYAGWAIKAEKFFAMGSGPMRAAAGREPILEKVGGRETARIVVGVLEGRTHPTAEVYAIVAEACGTTPEDVVLLIAPTASLAGTVQVVARSVETAMHKLAELGFDLDRVVSAVGTAPLPPVAKTDLEAIGRTNDSILYGARVVLYVTGDDASLEAIGPRVPSSASKDHGEPFSAIFARYNNDFYAVDPHLFSPAEIVFANVETGRSLGFGRLEPGVLERSFLLA